MNDIIITITVILLACVLVIVIPVMTMSDRIDDISQAQVEALVADYVDEMRTTRKITQERHDKFLANLTATGYTFDVEMEVKVLDENPGKKTSQTVRDKIGENVYYSKFTSQIEDELKNNNGVVNLNAGDIVVVTTKNSSASFGQKVKEMIYKIVGNDTANVVASKSGMVQ